MKPVSNTKTYSGQFYLFSLVHEPTRNNNNSLNRSVKNHPLSSTAPSSNRYMMIPDTEIWWDTIDNEPVEQFLQLEDGLWWDVINERAANMTDLTPNVFNKT